MPDREPTQSVDHSLRAATRRRRAAALALVGAALLCIPLYAHWQRAAERADRHRCEALYQAAKTRADTLHVDAVRLDEFRSRMTCGELRRVYSDRPAT